MNDVVIPLEKYNEMVKRIEELEALEAGGVDNWEWYWDSLVDWRKKYLPES